MQRTFWKSHTGWLHGKQAMQPSPVRDIGQSDSCSNAHFFSWTVLITADTTPSRIHNCSFNTKTLPRQLPQRSKRWAILKKRISKVKQIRNQENQGNQGTRKQEQGNTDRRQSQDSRTSHTAVSILQSSRPNIYDGCRLFIYLMVIPKWPHDWSWEWRCSLKTMS